jgi:hypothetical protein
VAVLQFKFDESYDDQVMSVGGWIGNELEWKRLESVWQRRIDFENARNLPDRQITRFHATEMNCKGGEYKSWDKEMCLQLSKKLIHMIAKRKMGAIAIGCDMNAIREIFPGGDERGLLRRSYVLCMKQLMVSIAHILEDYFPNDHVLLIHDHNNWDEDALHGYNLLIDDPDWGTRGLFKGLLSKTGKDDVGLQAADMMAYESFKAIKAKIKSPAAAMRGAVQEMVKRDIPIQSQWIDRKAALALYDVMKQSGKYPDLETKGVT